MSSERNVENQNGRNPDDYSYIKVFIKHKKRQLLGLTAALVKNLKRITWSNRKKLVEEFMCVMVIVCSFSLFFYLIFLFISSLL